MPDPSMSEQSGTPEHDAARHERDLEQRAEDHAERVSQSGESRTDLENELGRRLESTEEDVVDKPVSPFRWSDIDGDEGNLTTEDTGTPASHPAIAKLEVIDAENHSEHAVYVTPDQAREIIAWLTARLWKPLKASEWEDGMD